mmetsp:Transcript_7820/g.22963  ORF Transcript_7820/g.22963 Transcript_7820/m.22963 type:complete len:344 (-) Transcript_7820:1525-2556(-)
MVQDRLPGLIPHCWMKEYHVQVLLGWGVSHGAQFCVCRVPSIGSRNPKGVLFVSRIGEVVLVVIVAVDVGGSRSSRQPPFFVALPPTVGFIPARSRRRCPPGRSRHFRNHVQPSTAACTAASAASRSQASGGYFRCLQDTMGRAILGIIFANVRIGHHRVSYSLVFALFCFFQELFSPLTWLRMNREHARNALRWCICMRLFPRGHGRGRIGEVAFGTGTGGYVGHRGHRRWRNHAPSFKRRFQLILLDHQFLACHPLVLFLKGFERMQSDNMGLYADRIVKVREVTISVHEIVECAVNVLVTVAAAVAVIRIRRFFGALSRGQRTEFLVLLDVRICRLLKKR